MGLPFWQETGAYYCSQIPGSGASNARLFGFLTRWIIDDGFVEMYLPYYYQAATQLGWGSSPTEHLEDLLQTQAVPRDYLPAGVSAAYDPDSMVDVQDWVDREGDRLLFIYGEWDPWYGGAFELGDAVDSFRFVAPRRNHSASISQLEDADRASALDRLSCWTGVTAGAGPGHRRLPEPPPPPPPPRMRLAPR